MSDCWRGYSGLKNNDMYRHLTVNHRFNFVDPESSIFQLNQSGIFQLNHYQELIHKTLKELGVPPRKGIKITLVRRQMLDSYLCEFLWRAGVKRRNVDAFEEILDTIKEYIPPT